MTETRICLIHGAATTSAIWHGVATSLARLAPEAEVVCPDRPASGSLDLEIAALAPHCVDALVVGVSGGATLGLELLARGVALRAAILHEPAVGSLRPGLLDGVAEAYARGGVPAFGATLYGPLWQAAFAPADEAAVARDLAMFRRFEPRRPVTTTEVLITVGADSPEVRHEAAQLLGAEFGYPVRTLDGAGHAVHLGQPELFARLIVAVAASLGDGSPASRTT